MIIIMAEIILFTGMAWAASQLINNPGVTADGYSELDSRINGMENRINELESKQSIQENKFNEMHQGTAYGSIAVLFGCFCALWAQNTRRNATAWFFLGLIFTFFAAFAVVWKNYADLSKNAD